MMRVHGLSWKVLGLLVLAMGWGSNAYADCDTQLASVYTPVAPWSKADQNLKLTVDDLFPAGYLKDLKESIGEPQLTIGYGSNINIQVMAGNQNVARFMMQETPGEPQVLTIESLRLENPLSTRGKMHSAQYKKGLPPEVFNYAKHEIFEVAKAGGYTGLRAPGSQNYMVNFLYRRSIGMSPTTPEAVAFQTYLDRVFKLARGLPEDARITSLDQFSKATVSLPSGIRQKWQNYLSTGVLPSELEVIQMDDQPAILIDRSLPEGARTFIIRQSPVKNVLLDWNQGLHSPERILVRSLQ